MKRRKNRRRNKNRMAAFLAAVFMTALCLCQAAFAAERTGMGAEIDTARPVSLTIDLGGEDRRATLSIYRAGSWDERAGEYRLDGEFAEAEADIDGWEDLDQVTADEMKKVYAALSAYADAKGIRPIQTLTTENGKLRFAGLAEGLYFIAQEERDADNVDVLSSLISLPMWDSRTGWNYDGTALPKNEPKEEETTAPEDPTEPSENPTEQTPENPENPSGPENPTEQTPENPENPSGPENPAEPTTESPVGPGGDNGGNGGGGGGGRGGRDRTGGGGDPTTTIGDPDPALANLENIADEDVPLATNPILQAIEDVLVPLGLLPKTADGSVSYTPLLTALAVSGALIILLIVKRRKREK